MDAITLDLQEQGEEQLAAPLQLQYPSPKPGVQVRLFYFADNSGIIEPSWTPFDTFAPPIDYCNSALFNDRDPVPALQELVHEGCLRS